MKTKQKCILIQHLAKFLHGVTTNQELHLYVFLFVFWCAMVSLLVKLVEFFNKY